jgi:hypothetical protein
MWAVEQSDVRTESREPRPDTLGFTADKNCDGQTGQQAEQPPNVRPTFLDIADRSGSNPRTGPNVPRHDVPGDRTRARNAGLFVQQQEVLGGLVWVVPGDEPASDRLWPRRFEQEEAVGIEPAVSGVTVRHSNTAAALAADLLYELGQRGDVGLRQTDMACRSLLGICEALWQTWFTDLICSVGLDGEWPNDRASAASDKLRAAQSFRSTGPHRHRRPRGASSDALIGCIRLLGGA